MTAFVVLAGAACMGPAQAQSQMQLNQEAGAEFQKADRQLNDVYKKLLAATSADWKAKLTAAQLAWITFRNRECEFETIATVGGSIHGMMVANCQTRLTLHRVGELERLLKCEEGDLSCPPLSK
jgi:uncharacterized protein YecT (DUF1311 family)